MPCTFPPPCLPPLGGGTWCFLYAIKSIAHAALRHCTSIAHHTAAQPSRRRTRSDDTWREFHRSLAKTRLPLTNSTSSMRLLAAVGVSAVPFPCCCIVLRSLVASPIWAPTSASIRRYPE